MRRGYVQPFHRRNGVRGVCVACKYVGFEPDWLRFDVWAVQFDIIFSSQQWHVCFVPCLFGCGRQLPDAGVQRDIQQHLCSVHEVWDERWRCDAPRLRVRHRPRVCRVPAGYVS